MSIYCQWKHLVSISLAVECKKLSIIPAHTTAVVEWSGKVRRKFRILDRIVFIQVLLDFNSTRLHSRSFLIHWLAETAVRVVVLCRVLASVDWTSWNVHRALFSVFIISTTYSCRCCSWKILRNSNTSPSPIKRILQHQFMFICIFN